MNDILPLLPFVVQQVGSCFCIKVTPGARKNAVKMEPVGDIKMRVYVTESAEKGRANEAVLKILASALNIPVSRLKIVRGGLSRIKHICLSDN